MFKAGEYIRTKNGIIFKVDKEKKNIQINEFMNMGGDRDIKAHSKNIAELIEVGDIVNGNLIIEEYIDIKDDEENFISMCVKKGIQVDRDEYEEGGCIDIGDYFYFKPLENINIKTILTHELYEQDCYKVGDVE